MRKAINGQVNWPRGSVGRELSLVRVERHAYRSAYLKNSRLSRGVTLLSPWAPGKRAVAGGLGL